MARIQAVSSQVATPQSPNTIGTSSTGACVVEIDMAQIKNQGQLRAALNNVFFQFSSILPT
jgi:hypothetical protein